ncbi:hypothetical protein ABOM_005444 [Aspergillus bombycis]|uniref:Uncharacterized protein n=1 Tax=Aspergillus bombycis TaxID=109264 RepID=A0A1F8A1W0_9EURO|nr:hypothetical protein ABOM_005444 [Aspergillus bombycis]OGM45677.1 hypothetical protein ABOM_005444 [Aspergillus bombycis]
MARVLHLVGGPSPPAHIVVLSPVTRPPLVPPVRSPAKSVAGTTNARRSAVNRVYLALRGVAGVAVIGKTIFAACHAQCPAVLSLVTSDATFFWVVAINAQASVRYDDINVNEDPLIFLSCGHYYTVSSLDGIMEIKEYYNVHPHTGTIVSPRLSRRVMSDDAKLPGCPECRMPLRDIHRYNRIVKKALLDESTKRFIVTANLAYKKLVIAIEKHETQLEEEGAELIRKLSMGEEQSGHSHNANLFNAYCRKGSLENVIQKFVNSMAAAEQPYGRVNNLLASAAVGQNSIRTDSYSTDDSKIQTGFQIRGKCLQLRLAWAMLWGYRRIYIVPAVDSEIRSELRNVVANQIKSLLDTSISVWDDSQAAKLLAEQVQAMVYYALFCILYLSNCEEKGQHLDMDTATKLRQNASDTLEKCDNLRNDNPGTLGFLQDDIEKAKRLLNGGTFYSFVTAEEKRQVLRSGNVECRWKQPDVFNAEKESGDITMSPYQECVARTISSKRLDIFSNSVYFNLNAAINYGGAGSGYFGTVCACDLYS